jgi:hypothetical protein
MRPHRATRERGGVSQSVWPQPALFLADTIR